jgi:outer membrane protein assembly factor BamB
VRAAGGEYLWGIDLPVEYDTEVPLWYTGQCPLIRDGMAVLAPGGRALLIGVDCATGRVLWETPNPEGWKMSHASVMPMAFDGRAMFVYCAIGGVVGVAADGPDVGRVLWETTAWKHPVVAPSAVELGDGRVFVTAGYGAGSAMLQVRRTAGEFAVDVLYELERTVFACEQHTPVFHRGHLFAVLPADAGTLSRQLACLHPDGTLAWTSGKADRFGLGPFMVADEKIFVLDDDGTLSLVRADPQQYTPLARAQVLDGRDAWAPMALADGRLLLRDSKRMVCLDVRERSGGE